MKEFFNNLGKFFLADISKNIAVPWWMALSAFAAVVILLAVIIGVSLNKKDKKKANAAKITDNETALEATLDSSDVVNDEASDSNIISDAVVEPEIEHIINIERELQLNNSADNQESTAPVIEEIVVETIPQATIPTPTAPKAEEKLVVKVITPTPASVNTVKLYNSQPKIVTSPTAPVAMPIHDDGKTVYTKGVSGKIMPPTSIAKPLVNTINPSTDMNHAAQPATVIAETAKPAAKPISAPLVATKVVATAPVVAEQPKATSTAPQKTAAPTPVAAPKATAPTKSAAKPATDDNTKATKAATTAPQKAAAPTPVAAPKATAPTKSAAKPATDDNTKATKAAEVKPIKTVKSINEDSDAPTFGKYIITMNKSNIMRPYKFELRANNGQLLFESEPYKVKPRMASITAFRNNTKEGTFFIDEDKQGTFRYKLYNVKGDLVGVGEGYKARRACESSIESTKSFADSATVLVDETDSQ